MFYKKIRRFATRRLSPDDKYTKIETPFQNLETPPLRAEVPPCFSEIRKGARILAYGEGYSDKFFVISQNKTYHDETV
jgi:hypothetical protein